MDKETIAHWQTTNTSLLVHAGIESARLDCLLLLQDELNKSKEWLLAHSEEAILKPHLIELNKKIAQRAQRTPLAYVRNTQEFYGRNFYVDSNVLVPRPESEAMINLLISANKQKVITIIDIGTGSGCLAITAKLEFPTATVLATDTSEPAIIVAKKNASTHKADIQFEQTSLLPACNYQPPVTVLANLPYVPDGLVTSHEITLEPSEALFSGKDGMEHYTALWAEITGCKDKPDMVITESLLSQHDAMLMHASKAGYSLDKTQVLAQRFVKNNI